MQRERELLAVAPKDLELHRGLDHCEQPRRLDDGTLGQVAPPARGALGSPRIADRSTGNRRGCARSFAESPATSWGRTSRPGGRTQPVPFRVLHHAYRAGEIFAYWMNGVNGPLQDRQRTLEVGDFNTTALGP